MLAITRKTGEALELTVPPSDGHTVIRVIVGEAHRGRAKLAVDAPRVVLIRRVELTPHEAANHQAEPLQ